MIKKSAVKEAFELLSKSNRVYTRFGVYQARWIQIKIIEVGSRFAVALYKGFLCNGVEENYCSLRSFPMSYRSAYRLVCSL